MAANVPRATYHPHLFMGNDDDDNRGDATTTSVVAHGLGRQVVDKAVQLGIHPLLWQTNVASLVTDDFLGGKEGTSAATCTIAWIPHMSAEVLLHLDGSFVGVQTPDGRMTCVDKFETPLGPFDMHYSIVSWIQCIPQADPEVPVRVTFFLDRVTHIAGRKYALEDLTAHEDLVKGIMGNLRSKPGGAEIRCIHRARAMHIRDFWTNFICRNITNPPPMGLRFEAHGSRDRRADRLWLPAAAEPGDGDDPHTQHPEAIDHETLFSCCERQHRGHVESI